MKTFIKIFLSVSVLFTAQWAYAYEPPECDGKFTLSGGTISCQKEQWFLPTPSEVKPECAFSALSSTDGTAICTSRWSHALFQKHYLVTQETKEGKYGSKIQTFSVQDLGLHWTPTGLNIISLIALSIALWLVYDRSFFFATSSIERVAISALKAFVTFFAWITCIIYIVEINRFFATTLLFIATILAIHNGMRHFFYVKKSLESMA